MFTFNICLKSQKKYQLEKQKVIAKEKNKIKVRNERIN